MLWKGFTIKNLLKSMEEKFEEVIDQVLLPSPDKEDFDLKVLSVNNDWVLYFDEKRLFCCWYLTNTKLNLGPRLHCRL